MKKFTKPEVDFELMEELDIVTLSWNEGQRDFKPTSGGSGDVEAGQIPGL